MNRHVPHVLVLPEDDANRQLANGFVLENSLDTRRIQVLQVAGGWELVLEKFTQDHIRDMERNPNRFIVLLIDFDERSDRLETAAAKIPNNLRGRVFILGVWSHPEKLRKARGEDFETIGLALARDCRDNTEVAWPHPLLSHNAIELERLRSAVQPILFHGA